MRIIKVAEESPIVYAGYLTYLRGDIDKEEMLILCIEGLAKESKAYHDIAVVGLSNRVSPSNILILADTKEGVDD